MKITLLVIGVDSCEMVPPGTLSSILGRFIPMLMALKAAISWEYADLWALAMDFLPTPVAPIPEPCIMLLKGSGVVEIAGAGKRFWKCLETLSSR
jgi:hypothetical protein